MTSIVQVNEPTVTLTVNENAVTVAETVNDVTLEVAITGPQGAAGSGVPAGGTTGQILAKASATDYDDVWIDNYTTDVRKWVKSDYVGTLPKGTVVYISGADGNNALVLPAIATTDGTSANTIGFLAQPLTHNEFGWVIVEGTLTGIDTSGASAAGDPVWLSGTTAGGVAYGLANKPLAPYHLVFLGTVTRKNANNGAIEISINNGWELDELHNVSAVSPSNNDLLKYNSATGLWQNAQTITASQISDGTTTFARLAAANAFTVGGHTITNAAGGVLPLTIIGHASQSVPIFAVQTSDTVNRLRVTSTGSVVANGVTANLDGSTSIVNTGPASSILTLTGAPNQTAASLVINNGGSQSGNFIDAGGVFCVTVGGRVGVRTLTLLSASLNVDAVSATNIGAIIKGATSQTANLTEWRDGANGVLSFVDSTGTFGAQYFTNRTNTTNAFIDWTTNTLRVTNRTAASVPFAVRGVASQTGDLTVWQDSTPTNLARVDANGNFITIKGVQTGSASFAGVTWNGISNPTGVTTLPSLVVKAVTSQTGDLLQLQSDTGTVLVAVYASGTSVFNNRVVVGGDASARMNIVSSSATQVQTVIRGTTSQTADLLQFQNVSAQVMAKVDVNGFGVFGGGTAIANALISSTPYGSTQVGVAVKMAAAPSAHAISVYNSANTYLTGIDGYGALTVRNAGTTSYASLAVSALINTGNTANLGLVVQGQANQYNDLVRYGDNTAVAIGGRNSNAQMFVGASTPLYFPSGGATTAATGDGTTATITTTAAHGIAVGDMITVAGITPTGYNGVYRVTAVPTTTSVSYANATTGAQTVAGTVSTAAAASIVSRSAATVGLAVRGNNSNYRFIVQDSTGGSYNFYVNQYGNSQANGGMTVTGSMGASPVVLSALASGATHVGLVVRGYTSQTANLTEWQAVSGTVSAGVTAGGAAFFARSSAFASTVLSVSTAATTNIGLVIQGIASQTADLTQWQNSSGTVTAKVSNSGIVYGTDVRTINNRGLMVEENSGATFTLLKTTATPNVPGASGYGKLYFRDGTNAGTLKLVVIAGTAGTETTILDNIPQ